MPLRTKALGGAAHASQAEHHHAGLGQPLHRRVSEQAAGAVKRQCSLRAWAPGSRGARGGGDGLRGVGCGFMRSLYSATASLPRSRGKGFPEQAAGILGRPLGKHLHRLPQHPGHALDDARQVAGLRALPPVGRGGLIRASVSAISRSGG